jgi:hypothetical protein
MFEAIANTYKHFDFGKVHRAEEDHTVTESGVWCHVLSTKRMLELQEREQETVNYVPNPCLYVKSSIEKSRIGFCLVLTEGELTDVSKKICSHFSSLGLPAKRIPDSTLHPKERLRAFREASFVLAQDCSQVLSQLSLCSSGTPFVLLDRPTPVFKNFVDLANVPEVMSGGLADPVSAAKEIFFNQLLFKELVDATVSEMKNLRSWQQSIHAFPRGNGKRGSKSLPFCFGVANNAFAEFSYGPGIYFSLEPYEIFARKQVVMCPWVGYFNFDPLQFDSFRVSLVTCMGIITETQVLADTLRRHVGSVPVSLLPLVPSEFKLEEWKMKAKITCKNGVVVSSDLSTLSGRLSKTEKYENEILVFEQLPDDFESLVSRGVPFVCPELESEKLKDYPGFCNTKLTPETVAKFLTKSKVEEIVAFLDGLRAENYLAKFQRTAVWTNCA